MQHGRNNGKKLMAVRIIKHSFDIIHLLTDQNPIQVLVDAIINRQVAAMSSISVKSATRPATSCSACMAAQLLTKQSACVSLWHLCSTEDVGQILQGMLQRILEVKL